MRTPIGRCRLLAGALAVLALSAALPGIATAQPKTPDQDPLVGLWRGEVRGMQGNPRRTLRIVGLRPDGRLEADWLGQPIQVTRRASDLTFMTRAGNQVVLTPQPDGSLAGWLITKRGQGDRHPLVMRRQP